MPELLDQSKPEDARFHSPLEAEEERHNPELPYVDNEGPERKLKLPTRALEIYQEVTRKPAVHALLKELKERDLETYEHTKKVTLNALAIAWINREEKLDKGIEGIDDADMATIVEASLLHDLGKMDLPFVPRDNPPEDEDGAARTPVVLVKPHQARRPLKPEEREIMKRHALLSIQHLEHNKYLDNREVLGLIALHHQRQHDPTLEANDAEAVLVDLHLSRDERRKIRIFQQFIEVGDKFDALDSERPYKPAKSPDQTKEIIEHDFRTHGGNIAYVEQMMRLYYPGLYATSAQA